MTEFLCFGSSNDNHVVSIEMAERHARIEKKGADYLIRDLRSASGTFVNGVKVLECYLNPGDILKIGETEFVFHSPISIEQNEVLTSQNKKWNDQLLKLKGIAQSDLTVLVLGPSGTGKEILSQHLHKVSARKDSLVLTVNCSALTESLAESELFGHEKGSFTGATRDRKGAFEIAKNGTLILDEIGDLPLNLQPKLLRALENKEIKPVGSDRVVKTNVRIIACTHQDLKKKVERGEFRLDLFYRLNILQIAIPALKDRMEDFEDLLFKFAKEIKVKFSPCAIQELKNHSWPGNIRELKNLVSRARALMSGEAINKDAIHQLLDQRSLEVESFGLIQIPNAEGDGKVNVIKEIEKQIIQKRLLINGGNQRKTASDLGVPKSTLSDRIRGYKIDVESLLKGKFEKEIWGQEEH